MVDTTLPLVGYYIQIVPERLLKIELNSSQSDVFHLEEIAQSGTLVGAKLGEGHPWLGQVASSLRWSWKRAIRRMQCNR